MFCLVASSLGHLRSQCFDRLRLLIAKGTQGVCGGVEEIGVGFQQWCVAGSQTVADPTVVGTQGKMGSQLLLASTSSHVQL